MFIFAAFCHIRFWKLRKLLTTVPVNRPILHQHTKFREDRSNRRYNIASFVIFKVAAAAILVFQKSGILTGGPLKGAKMCHHTKFHQNRSSGCGNMAI